MIEQEIVNFVNGYTDHIDRCDVEVRRFKNGDQGEHVRIGTLFGAAVYRMCAPGMQVRGCASKRMVMGQYHVFLCEHGVYELQRSTAAGIKFSLVLNSLEIAPEKMEHAGCPKVQNPDFAEVIFRIQAQERMLREIQATVNETARKVYGKKADSKGA